MALGSPEAILAALGGPENVKDIEACITRLRLEVANPAAVNDKQLKALGAVGVMKMGRAVQVVLGTEAEAIEQQIRRLLGR